ncbi:hypothetical protein BU26DRAFT_321377 [Trematosphaeria pertusa]|uniref:Uncharacterized protein n=1 Tax=Trematosphaeria pertusa TaxID=390896 RepID=A0A6A6ICN0_9PLEO|nr:uncharacterized protein BU26DRAFT_321377 [Trematosphaeria pertusa]KAF2247818.1 hypothetical protein BU26DRAFT_321377 [Trematosphaeria pertusa]
MFQVGQLRRMVRAPLVGSDSKAAAWLGPCGWAGLGWAGLGWAGFWAGAGGVEGGWVIVAPRGRAHRCRWQGVRWAWGIGWFEDFVASRYLSPTLGPLTVMTPASISAWTHS